MAWSPTLAPVVRRRRHWRTSRACDWMYGGRQAVLLSIIISLMVISRQMHYICRFGSRQLKIAEMMTLEAIQGRRWLGGSTEEYEFGTVSRCTSHRFRDIVENREIFILLYLTKLEAGWLRPNFVKRLSRRNYSDVAEAYLCWSGASYDYQVRGGLMRYSKGTWANDLINADLTALI